MNPKVRKYSILIDWYVQVTPTAVMQPVDTATEMLARFKAASVAGLPVQCGVMRLTVVTATGERTALEYWPMDEATGALILPMRTDATSRTLDMIAPFVDALTRAHRAERVA